jgi:two-component system sensor histidine kinase UhpB
VSITLKEDTGAVYATITDDGHGFDYEALVKTGGRERSIGLAGMQERAVLLDGILTIHSTRGHGAQVEVRIPLPSTGEWRRPTTDELAVQEA